MATEPQLMAMDLSASLWLSPCSFEELYNRGVLEGVSQYSFNTILNIAKSKNWIYERGDILYCYKKTVKNVLNPEGYELDLPTKRIKSDFEKEFEKYNKNLGF